MYPSIEMCNTKKETRTKENKTIGPSQKIQKENDVGVAEVKRYEGYPKKRLKMDQTENEILEQIFLIQIKILNLIKERWL